LEFHHKKCGFDNKKPANTLMLRVYFWLRGHAATFTEHGQNGEKVRHNGSFKGHTSPGGIVFVSCASMARKTRLDVGDVGVEKWSSMIHQLNPSIKPSRF
jgi:hypothetical protein